MLDLSSASPPSPAYKSDGAGRGDHHISPTTLKDLSGNGDQPLRLHVDRETGKFGKEGVP